MGRGYDKVGNQQKISVTLSGVGRVPRDFRSRGEAIAYLERNYGYDYSRLRPSFQTVFVPNMLNTFRESVVAKNRDY